MKKTVLFAVFIATLIFCVSLSSACNRRNVDKGRNGDSSTVTDGLTVTLPPDDGINIADAKIEALRILTPRASDKEPIMDGIVHRYIYGHGSNKVGDELPGLFGDDYKPNLPNEPYGNSQLFLMRRSGAGGGTPEIMCKVEGCKHNDITCPAFVYYFGMVLPVTDKNTGRTVVYTELPFNPLYVPIWGKSVNLTKEFGLPEEVEIYEVPRLIKHVIMEYDLETGERRAVAECPPNHTGQIYYNGRLYFNIYGWYDYPYGGSSNFDYNPRMCYVDVSSGETVYCTEPNGEQSYLYFFGIYEEKIYALSQNGEVIIMNLDFGEREVWGKIENFTTVLTFENDATSDYRGGFINAAFVDGYLYTVTYDSVVNNHVIHKISLRGEWNPEVIPGVLLTDYDGLDSIGIYKKDEPEGIEYYYKTINNDGFSWLHRPTEPPQE